MLKRIDQKYLMFAGVILGIIVLFIVIILVMSACQGNKKGYSNVELRMQKAAISYFEKHDKDLPQKDGSTARVSLEKLVNSGNMPAIDKLVDEGVSCSGEVNVTNNNEHYIYLPYLNCGKAYKTEKLSEKIIATDELNEVDEGLYESEDEDDVYVFRGENVNNYLTFANKTWRIIRINSDNSIKVIAVDRVEQKEWDNRYNVDKRFTAGINDYSVSRIKAYLQELYNSDDFFKDADRSMIKTEDLCVGHRSESDLSTDGSVECSTTFDDQQIGLIQINEFITPSLDPNCKASADHSCSNYNYLGSFERAYWTITADTATTYMVYYIDGYASLRQTGNISGVNPVITLTKNLVYASGDGTLEKPYKIKKY